VPGNVIPRKLMGIEPLEPGFKRFRLRPQPGGLAHAAIRTPTPRGPVEVRFTRPGGRWQIEFAVPAGTMAEVHLPANTLQEVTVETKDTSAPLRFLRKENGRVVAEAGPGKWKTTCLSGR
jgi:hypothetical protein